MINFEGDLNEPYRCSNDDMSIEDEVSDIFELLSVTVDDFEAHVDAQISLTQASLLLINDDSIYYLDNFS